MRGPSDVATLLRRASPPSAWRVATPLRMQTTLETWVEVAPDPPTPPTSPRTRVVTLFDSYGLAALPWAARGFECAAYHCNRRTTTQGVAGVRIASTKLADRNDILSCLQPTHDLAFVIALPPCRDLCAAGARWWKRKRGSDPDFQKRAEDYLKMLYETLDSLSIPFLILVPSSPYIRRCFNRRAFAFSPHEFGGYLQRESTHPLFTEIPPQDAYTKRTLCFHGRGIRMPFKRPVTPEFKTIHRKNGSTKNISPIMASRRKTGARVAPPLAFCTAVASLNSGRSESSP